MTWLFASRVPFAHCSLLTALRVQQVFLPQLFEVAQPRLPAGANFGLAFPGNNLLAQATRAGELLEVLAEEVGLVGALLVEVDEVFESKALGLVGRRLVQVEAVAELAVQGRRGRADIGARREGVGPG